MRRQRNREKIRPLRTLVFVMTVLSLTSAAHAGKYALVIGNGSYAEVPLPVSENDADVMASTLRSLGFSVSKETDMNQRDMKQAIRDFGNSLSRGDTALFYFSGHGAQVNGMNYLIPIGADIRSEDEVGNESVPADMVLAKMKSAGSAVNIIILDACRNNPFKGFKSMSQGLAPMSAAAVRGTYITYAAADGAVAYTGTGSTSIYTKHLVKFMKTPGLRIEDVFKRVRESVMADTSEKQIPFESSSLTGKDFYFADGSAVRLSEKPIETFPSDIGKGKKDDSDMPEHGMWVMEVESGSEAENAGFLKGQILISINEEVIEKVDTANRIIANNVGSKINALLWIDGKKITVTVTPKKRYIGITLCQLTRCIDGKYP